MIKKLNSPDFVYTKQENCKGCNKCIFVCPTKANEAFFEADTGKVFIKNGFCISCGECLNICDHQARDFKDDTERFFADLKRGEKISVVVAPAAWFNFDLTTNILGFLKAKGINNVYDVSLGADICTWGHLKAIGGKKNKRLIAQPCPVVVSNIEKYFPNLISYLSPIHSPVSCLAIYLQKYLALADKIMFLSPCIGKKREIISPHTPQNLAYNITFSKFIDYLQKHNINLADYPALGFDNIEGSLGFAFPRPGGLSENLKFHYGEDIWIKQIEGIGNINNYLQEYSRDIAQGNPVPQIIDALNCEHGCNLGTGTKKTASLNQVDFKINQNKKKLDKEEGRELMGYFDQKLNLEDFMRSYTNKSAAYRRRNDVDLETAFISLGKISAEDREINCFSCGYGNCYDFAYDLATGHNDRNNCRHYLLNKFKKLSLIDDLTGSKNRYSFSLVVDSLKANHPGFVGIIYIDINGLKQANDIHGHSFGDQMIINCCDILKDTFNGSVYRIGGDEFIILAENYSAHIFAELYTHLQQAFTEQDGLMVSMGMAHSLCATDLEQKMEAADQQMYHNKQEYYRKKQEADRRQQK